MSRRLIMACPNCQGSGKVKQSNSLNFGLLGAIATLGVLNALDAIMSQSWEEECQKCCGFGGVIVVTKEQN